MNNERFPRTLSEAFGPHTSYRIEPMPMTQAERDNRELVHVGWIALVLGIAGIGFAVMGAWGYLA